MPNGFLLLYRELFRRSLEPWRNFSFFTGVMLNVLFGGWAIWLELLAIHLQIAKHDVESVQSAMVTFFPAIIGASFVQGVFENRADKRLLAFFMLFLICTLGPAVYFAFVAAEQEHMTFRTVVLAIFCLAAMWFWWIVNADAESFRDDAATGGDPKASLGDDLDGLVG